jgi:hypothetical protein
MLSRFKLKEMPPSFVAEFKVRSPFSYLLGETWTDFLKGLTCNLYGGV